MSRRTVNPLLRNRRGFESLLTHHIEAYCILEQGRAPEATPVLTVLKYGVRVSMAHRDLLRVKEDSYSMLQYGSGKMRGPAAQPSG